MPTWTRATKTGHCPLCGRKSYCSWTDGGQVVCCTKLDKASTPEGWRFVKTTSEGHAIFTNKPEEEYEVKGFKPVQNQFRRSLNRELMDQLMAQLEMPRASIKALDPGWVGTYEGMTYNAWTFPERNARGTLVGFSTRPQDSSQTKRMVKDSKHGLFIPSGFRMAPDPVLLPEGASDVIALHAVGITAVGRPSNKAGVSELAKLCRDRDVIVIAEFDPSANRGDWPGVDGAKYVAEKLSTQWGRKVKWAMPPEGSKDLREYIAPLISEILSSSEDDIVERNKVGVQLLSHIKEMSRDLTGPQESKEESRLCFRNVNEVWEDGDKPVKLYITMKTIIANAIEITDGNLFKCNSLLFIPSGKLVDGLPTPDSIRTLDSTEEFFAYMHEKASIRWPPKGDVKDPSTREFRTAPTKGEAFRAMTANIEPNYESIEMMPHQPRREKSYYVDCELPKSDGKALREFIDHLNPATEMDRILMVACLLSMLWGGPDGKRPGFIFTSDNVAAGKTTTANMLAQVVGGSIMMEEGEDWQNFLQRLLSDNALSKRVVLIDNVRGRLARSCLESIITAPQIDGKRMFFGQYQRPNTLTWLITSNSPSLSDDLTDRCVIIKIGKPKHAVKHDSWWTKFIENYRAALISDCVAMLKRGPQCTVDDDRYDRWGPWIDGVLRCFIEAPEVLDYIHEERVKVNQDLIDAEQIREVIAWCCEKSNVSMTHNRLLIGKQELRDLLLADGIIDSKMGVRGTTSFIKRLSKQVPLQELTESSHNGKRRAWMWTGKESKPDERPWTYDAGENHTELFAARPGPTTTESLPTTGLQEGLDYGDKVIF